MTKSSPLANYLKKYNPFVNSVEMLYKWNVTVAVILVVQAIVFIGVSAHKSLSVTATYLTTNPFASASAGKTVTSAATRHLFNLNLAYLIVIYMAISAIFHGLAAGYYRRQYEADLKSRINWLRWFDYGLSLSLILVIVGLISGIYDLASLIMIFSLGLILSVGALMLEIMGKAKNSSTRLIKGISVLSAVAIVAALLIYIIGSIVLAGKAIPDYVYYILVSTLILFVGLAINTIFQLQSWKKWANYYFAERIYILLSLAAQTASAWQLFAGMLHR